MKTLLGLFAALAISFSMVGCCPSESVLDQAACHCCDCEDCVCTGDTCDKDCKCCDDCINCDCRK